MKKKTYKIKYHNDKIIINLNFFDYNKINLNTKKMMLRIFLAVIFDPFIFLLF